MADDVGDGVGGDDETRSTNMMTMLFVGEEKATNADLRPYVGTHVVFRKYYTGSPVRLE